MTARFVTRHRGAAEWARRQGIADDVVAHLDPATVRPGDIILGTLPVSAVAEVCARGGRYFHLHLDLPQDLRGKELDADAMEALGARLEEYEARRVFP